MEMKERNTNTEEVQVQLLVRYDTSRNRTDTRRQTKRSQNQGSIVVERAVTHLAYWMCL